MTVAVRIEERITQEIKGEKLRGLRKESRGKIKRVVFLLDLLGQ